jgi:hypothetical protein
MTPKEKAENLFSLFQQQVSRNGHRVANVKKCATIAVDLIIQHTDETECEGWAYWQQVKEEIIKL